MDVRFLRMISAGRESLATGRVREDLRFLRERHGERIAALHPDTRAQLGWVSVYPDRDASGAFYHLVGLDVSPAEKASGLDLELLREAGRFMREHRVRRLRFGTSPLLTANASLYVTRLGARYRWKEGVRTPDGRPWPYVICECDFDDPLERPLDLTEEEVVPRSVLRWNGLHPSPRPRLVYSGALSILLPELDNKGLSDLSAADPSFLSTIHEAFQALFLHGYGFAWFDRLPSNPADTPGWYYVMNRTLAL